MPSEVNSFSNCLSMSVGFKRDAKNFTTEGIERGTRKTMADVGLDGEHAAEDIRALRGLLEAFNTAKRTVWQTAVKMVTTALIVALITGAAMREMASEAANSRLYGGIHFRFDNDDGLKMGKQVALEILRRYPVSVSW
jgi:hypothetical protein